MIEKDVIFDENARFKLSNGINLLANAVKQTLGAAGNTVIIKPSEMTPNTSKVMSKIISDLPIDINVPFKDAII